MGSQIYLIGNINISQLYMNVTFSCIKQFSSYFTHNSMLILFMAKERLLLDAIEGLILSSGNPVDFHSEI